MSNWGQQPPPGPYDGQVPGEGAGQYGSQDNHTPWGGQNGPANPGWQGAPQQQPYGQGAYGQGGYNQSGYGAPQNPYGQPGYGPGQGGFVPPGPAFVPQAAKPGVMSLRPQNVGDIFDAAFQTIRGNPGGSVGTVIVGALLAAILSAAFIITGAMNSSSADGTPDTAALVVIGLAAPIAGLAAMASAAGLVHVFAQAVMGRRATVSASLRVGVRRMWSMLGVGLLMVVIMVAVMVPLILAIVLAASQDNGGPIFLAVLVGIATICAVVWVGIRLCFAGHIVVMEKAGPTTALRRSWQLTKGRFWRTLGITILAQLIVSAISWVVQFIVSLIMLIFLGVSLAGASNGGEVSDTSVGAAIAAGVLAVVFTLLSYALIYPFTTNVTGALYVDARMRDEGLANQLMQLPSNAMAAKVKLTDGALDFPLPGAGAPGGFGQAPYGAPGTGPIDYR